MTDTAPGTRVPGPIHTGDPGVKEQIIIDRRIQSRLLGRSVRGPQNDPTNMDGQTGNIDDSSGSGGIGIGIAVGWDGRNRRTVSHRRSNDTVRFHRRFDPTSAVLGPDGFAYIRVGQCALDKVWELRSLILMYTDAWTVGPTGSQAGIFTGEPGNGIKLVDLILMGIAIPASVTWSHDQAVVYGGQVLYVAINDPGASPGLYIAKGAVAEFDHDSYRTRHL